MKILHSLLSSFLGIRSAEYLPCQVLFQNSNGKSSYFDLASWFWPIQKFLLHSKMTKRIKNELALVNQRGNDVIFASQQNNVANFLCNSDRDDTSSKTFSGVYSLLNASKTLCSARLQPSLR